MIVEMKNIEVGKKDVGGMRWKKGRGYGWVWIPQRCMSHGDHAHDHPKKTYFDMKVIYKGTQFEVSCLNAFLDYCLIDI
jgi:hypothetical protein